MTLSGYEVICAAGETFDSIALGIFGDEKYAADILCANPELGSKVRFDGGEVLLLPEIDAEPMDDEDEELPPEPEKAPWR